MPKKKREQVQMNLVLVALIILLGLVGFTLLSFLLPNSSAETEQVYFPTAQELEQYPLEAPTFIRVNDDCINERYCVRIYPQGLVDAAHSIALFSDMATLLQTLEIKVDGQRQTGGSAFVISTVIYASIPSQNLAEGLHLVEVSIADKQGLRHQHSWALRIGNSTAGASATFALPPTALTPTP